MENATSWVNDIYALAIQYAPKIVGALLTFLIGTWVINWLSNLLTNILKKRGIDDTIRPFLVSIISVGLKVMLLLSVAGMFGIQTTSFIAILTALVFAVGTALSGTLGHFASGVMILIFRPYKVGDLVTVAGQTGEIAEIQVFNTILKTPDNKKVIIPNGQVMSGIITNISGQGEIRVDMMYSVSNGMDIDKVRSVIQQVANNCPQVLKNPPIDIFVNQSPIGITEYAVRPWCKSEHYWDVYFYMQENVKKAFDQHNIALPKPGMDIKVTQN